MFALPCVSLADKGTALRVDKWSNLMGLDEALTKVSTKRRGISERVTI